MQNMKRYTAKGAAKALGISPSTLRSRARVRGIGSHHGRMWYIREDQLPALKAKGRRGNPNWREAKRGNQVDWRDLPAA
jgi:hypothetical protein